MRTVRRLFYVDIVSAVVFVALAFLALFFFIDFVDELGGIGQRGYSGAARGALLACCSRRAISTSCCRRGADRHHLRAGPAGAELAVHDPAHRRPRPGPRARPAGGAGAGLRRASPSSSATTWRRSARTSPARCARRVPRQPQARALAAPGSRSMPTPRPASAAIRSTSARPGPARCCAQVRIFEFDADGRLLSRTQRGRGQGARATAAGRCSDVVLTRWTRGGRRADRPRRSGSPRSTGRARSRPRWWPPRCCR